MILYDNPKNDNNGFNINPGYYIKVQKVQRSENTSSMYAYIKAFRTLDFSQYCVVDGWISLNSNNFVVYNF